MLKQGLFICGDGRQYTVYEQTVDNFSRIDFCNKDAQFHIDPAGVCFSIVKQKGTFIYGDRSIYNKYLSLLDTAHQFNLPTETSSEWQMGKYYKRLIRAQPSSQFLEETVQETGVSGAADGNENIQEGQVDPENEREAENASKEAEGTMETTAAATKVPTTAAPTTVTPTQETTVAPTTAAPTQAPTMAPTTAAAAEAPAEPARTAAPNQWT